MRRHTAGHSPGLMLMLFCVASWSEASERHFLSSKTETETFSVQTIQLKLEPEIYKGSCPVDITAEGVLLATETVQVQYRWLYQGAMGKIATLRLSKNKPETLTERFKNIGKISQANTLVLSSKHSVNDHALNLHTGTIKLLSLPMDEQDWRKAQGSAPVSYQVECVAQAKSEVAARPQPKADLMPGPGLTVAGASAPWGSTLAVDADSFQAARRGHECSLPFTYELTNHGKAEAGKSLARLFSGRLTLNSQSVGKLAPAEKITITDSLYLGDGRHVLGIKVDDADQVDESNESNNLQTITVMVSGCSS